MLLHKVSQALGTANTPLGPTPLTLYRLSLLFAYYGVVFRITTSFGFGVGNITIVADLIAAASALIAGPDQFKAVSDGSASRIPTTFLLRYPILLLLERY